MEDRPPAVPTMRRIHDGCSRRSSHAREHSPYSRKSLKTIAQVVTLPGLKSGLKSTRILACNVAAQLLDGLRLGGNDRVHKVADGDYAHKRSVIQDR
jgi:hypothetical protein